MARPAKAAECREQKCKAAIFFLISQRDPRKKVPVDAETVTDEDLFELENGEDVFFDSARGHVSHFRTCRAPRQFSKPKA